MPTLEEENVSPAWMYGDPAEVVDRKRAIEASRKKPDQKRRDQVRMMKARRIRELTKKAMKGNRR